MRGATGSYIGRKFSTFALGWLGVFPGALIGFGLGGQLVDNGCAMVVYGLMGMIIGAIVGGLAGLMLARFIGVKGGEDLAQRWGGPSLQERQWAFRTHLSSDIDTFFHEMQRAFDTHLDAEVRGVVTELGAAVQQHKSAHGAAVSRLRAQHEQKQRAVAQLVVAVRADAGDIRQRAANLELLRSRLASTRVPA